MEFKVCVMEYCRCVRVHTKQLKKGYTKTTTDHLFPLFYTNCNETKFSILVYPFSFSGSEVRERKDKHCYNGQDSFALRWNDQRKR